MPFRRPLPTGEEDMTNTKAKLRRGETGRCSRSTCICDAEGLGPECVWLVPTDVELERRTGEPHIDGYPLYSGLPPCAAAAIGEKT